MAKVANGQSMDPSRMTTINHLLIRVKVVYGLLPKCLFPKKSFQYRFICSDGGRLLVSFICHLWVILDGTHLKTDTVRKNQRR